MTEHLTHEVLLRAGVQVERAQGHAGPFRDVGEAELRVASRAEQAQGRGLDRQRGAISPLSSRALFVRSHAGYFHCMRRAAPAPSR